MKHKLINVILVLLFAFTLGACATSVPPRTNYAFDVYSYKLNQQDFNKLQKYLNFSTNESLTQTVLSNNAYWKFTDKFETESFFPNYKYTYTSCRIAESSPNIQSSALFSKSDKQCSYEYIDKETSLILTLNDIKKNDIYATITIYNGNESNIQNTVNYNIDHEFLIFSMKDSKNNLVFIVNRNWLSTPWSEYAKTPQALLTR